MAQLESQAIGQRIAQARKESGGMTQEELADLLAVTTRSIQGYEAGDVIPYRHFAQLGEIFGRPLEWFLHGEATRPADDQLLSHLEPLLQELNERLARIESLLSAPARPRKDRPPAPQR
jgi:transcriptional regulator with XRE-family HTH domain